MYPLKLHKTLTPEKWQKFGEAKQILMIACEISRARHWIKKSNWEAVNDCYERAFELLDLTVSLMGNKNKRKELLRLREVIASQYVSVEKDFRTNELIFQALLLLNPESYAMEYGREAFKEVAAGV